MKINNKYYFNANKVLNTNNYEIIYKYFQEQKIISESNQNKLVDIAVKSNNPNFIINVAIIIDNLKMYNENKISKLDRLADSIIKMNISDFILRFCQYVNGNSKEKRSELVDSFVNSESMYWNAYMHPKYNKIDSEEYRYAQKNRDDMLWARYTKSSYILNFLEWVNWLDEEDVSKLADSMIETKDVDLICQFLDKAKLSYDKSKKLEQYLLVKLDKNSLAKILKMTNNKELIKKIFRDKETLEKFLLDYENYENDNRSYEHIQMQDYHFSRMGVYGGVGSTSGFIPKQQLRVMGHKKRTAEELNAKYKFIDNNIQTVLNSMRKSKK